MAGVYLYLLIVGDTVEHVSMATWILPQCFESPIHELCHSYIAAQSALYALRLLNMAFRIAARE